MEIFNRRNREEYLKEGVGYGSHERDVPDDNELYNTNYSDWNNSTNGRRYQDDSGEDYAKVENEEINSEEDNDEMYEEYDDDDEEYYEAEYDEDNDEMYEEYDDEEEYYEAEYDDEEDYYGQEQGNLKRNLILIVLITVMVTASIFVYNKYIQPHFSSSFGNDVELRIDRANEVIHQMYGKTDINSLIHNNENILTYFDETLHDYIDIEDVDVYYNRYGYFSNEETHLEITNTYDANNRIVVEYTISSEYNIPSERISYFSFDETGLIIDYEEYVLYKLVPTEYY